MPADSNPVLQIPVEVRGLLWRIFGPGASPMRDKSAFHLIEPVIRKRSKLPRSQQNVCVAEIRRWFQSHDDNHWLVADMREPVAQAIVDGVGTDFSTDASVWAIASVDSPVILPFLRARWSTDDIRGFASRAVTVIQRAIERQRILDPLRASGYRGLDPAKTTVPLEAIERGSHLSTFRHLGNQGWELVHHALDAAVSNLVELLVGLDPSRFEPLIGDLNHPVLQALAAEHFVAIVRPTDHRAPLAWIHPESDDALVALAVFHTLNTVNLLDDEPESMATAGPQRSWRTDLRPDRDDFAAAASALVEGLVDRISTLPSKRSARWLGELLSAAPEILHGNRDRLKPRRVTDVETICTERLSSRLWRDFDDGALDAFRAGLCLTPRNTWTRHVADLAWAMRTDSPASAHELAHSTLDHHEQQIQCDVSNNQFFLHWDDWHHRDWTDAMGRALLLSNPRQSPCRFAEWVRMRCFELPLTIWDAEDRYASFLTADHVAQHWLLVAIHAVRYGSAIGQPVDPTDVRALSNLAHEHCRYLSERGRIDADASVIVEAAARMAVDLGEVQEAWLIQEAASLRLSPRALWAFADQYTSSRRRESTVDSQDADFADKFGRAAASRMGDPMQYSLESLCYWSLLWLLLNAHGPAEQTAAAIAAATSRPRMQTRATDILFLKLLALATLNGRVAPQLERRFIEIYRHLWLPYTPDHELADRAVVDKYLRQSGSSFGVAP